MKHATRLQHMLLQTKLTKDMDILLFANSLNRTSQYYGIAGDVPKARLCNLQAHNILESLVSSGLVDILNHEVYESIMWTRVTYNLDLSTLQNGYEWAKAHRKFNVLAYTQFLLIITSCNPEIKNPNSSSKLRMSNQEKQKSILLSLHAQLTEVIEVSKYREVKDGRRTYARLIDNGLAAMKSWITSDPAKSGQYVETAAIQAALLTAPSLEAFIPTYFAAFVGIQLLGVDQAKYNDVTELLVISLTRMSVFCWARVLTDFLISTLERFVGKLDIKWPYSAASTDNRHLQLLANASGSMFNSPNNGVHYNTTGGNHFNGTGGGDGGHLSNPTGEATTAGIISM